MTETKEARSAGAQRPTEAARSCGPSCRRDERLRSAAEPGEAGRGAGPAANPWSKAERAVVAAVASGFASAVRMNRLVPEWSLVESE